jgi:hypothetical protein
MLDQSMSSIEVFRNKNAMSNGSDCQVSTSLQITDFAFH